MTRTRLLIVGLIALVVAGCGGSPKVVSKAEYQTELQRLGKDLTDAGSELGRSIDIATFNRSVDNLQKHLRDAAGKLDDLRPPANAEAVNNRLADALRDFADTLEPVKDARRRSIVQARIALQHVGRSGAVRAGRSALRELQRQGYDVGQFGSL